MDITNKQIYVVYGKRWFDRKNGNTYHSVEVVKNGEVLKFLPFEYGYGDMYLQNAKDIIKKDNPKLENVRYWNNEDLEEFGVILLNYVCDVQRKKDL